LVYPQISDQATKKVYPWQACPKTDKKTRNLIPTLQLISQEPKIGLMALTPGWPGHAPGPGKMAPLSRIVLRLRPKGPLGVGLRLLKKDKLF